jgi:hypothetical protein
MLLQIWAPRLPAALRGVNFSEMFGGGCLIGGNADGLGRKASWSARRAMRCRSAGMGGAPFRRRFVCASINHACK